MKKVGKTLTAIGAAVLAGVLLRTCVATSYLIPSSGMENSLYQGERILVNKWSYGLRLPFMGWWGHHRWAARPVKREDIIVFNNPGNLRQPVISRREVFIGRCIGTPGDTLLVDSLFNVVPSEKRAPDQKFLFAYPRTEEARLDTLLHRLRISSPLLGSDSTRNIRSLSRYEYYLLEQAANAHLPLTPMEHTDSVKHLHALLIPGRGITLRVSPWNRTLLCNTLLLHEGRNAFIQGDTLYVDGKPADSCTFNKNYYWVTTNNASNLSDSRLFGLVPEDHVIGKAARIWFSKEQDTGLFSGYRWDRIGLAVK